MSIALATKVHLPGRLETVPFKAGEDVAYYLKALDAEIPDGHVAVVGGMPADTTTEVPEQAAVTVAPQPQNG